MTIIEKTIHHALIAILFSIINWIIIDNFIINISFWKYFIIELLLVSSLKIFKFTIQKLKLV
jgi:hypothetical protein